MSETPDMLYPIVQVSDKLTSAQKSVECSQATVQSSQLIEDTNQETVETL